MLKDTLREKAHVLTAAEENLLAQLSEVLGATNDVFTMLNNADMTFGTVSPFIYIFIISSHQKKSTEI